MSYESGVGDGVTLDPGGVRRAAAQRAAQPRVATTAARSASAPAPQPMKVISTRRGRRRGRRVKRVVRRVDLWSVLKVSLLFNTVMAVITVGAVALLWALGNTTGLVEDLEGFLRDSGFEDFRFDGDRMFTQVAIIAVALTLGLTVMVVLTVALFNLICEVTGGISFVVIEEIVPNATQPVAPSAAPAPARRPSPAATPAAPPPRHSPVPAPGVGRPAPAPAPPA